MNLLKQIFLYLRFVARRLLDDRCLTVAGSLTYTSLLALVPIFTVALTLAAEVPATQQFIGLLKGFVLKNLVPDVAGRLLGIYLEQFATNAAGLTLIGLAMIVFTAVAMLFTIDAAFNDIWRTRNLRSWWKRFFAYLMLLTLGPLMIGASLSMTSYLLHFARRLERVVPMFDDVVLRLVPFLLTTGALVLAYRIIPNRYVPMRHALAGGLFAALLFEVTKHVFVAFVINMPTYNLVYGAFASVPIFLVWMFCCWTVVLIGAEVTATFSYFRHPHAQFDDPLSRHRAALCIVDMLEEFSIADDAGKQNLGIQNVGIQNTKQKAQQKIQGVPFSTIRLRCAMPIDQAEDLLECLVKAEIVATFNKNGTAHYRLQAMRDDITDDAVRAALSPTYPKHVFNSA